MINESIKYIELIDVQSGEIYNISTNKKTLIGRMVDINDGHIQVDSVHISRNHCELFIENDELFIKDLDSRNGVYLNNEKITNQKKLKDADILNISHLKYQVVIEKNNKKNYLGDNIIVTFDTSKAGSVASLFSERNQSVVLYKYEMLRHHSNSNLLKPKLIVEEENTIIKYEVSHMITLKEKIQNEGKIDYKVFLETLKTIIESMNNSRAILIDNEDYILDMRCIFFDSNDHKLKLMINPFKHNCDFKISMSTFVSELLDWTEICDEFKYQINDYLQHDFVDINAFYKYIVLITVVEDHNKRQAGKEPLKILIEEKIQNEDKKIHVIENHKQFIFIVFLQLFVLLAYVMVLIKTQLSYLTYGLMVIFVSVIEYNLMKLYKTKKIRGESNA